MSLFFVPNDDYSTSASAAQELTSLCFPDTYLGDKTQRSFRIANSALDESVTIICTTYGLEGKAFPWFSAYEITIQPGGISNTITLTLTLGIDWGGGTVPFEINLVDSEDPYGTPLASIPATLPAVGANIDKGDDYFRRTGSVSEQLSGVIDRDAEVLRVGLYDPLDSSDALNPLVYSWEYDSVGFWLNGDPCARLHKSNTAQGYDFSCYQVEGSFQQESESYTLEFRYQEPLTFTHTARLYLPVWHEINFLYAPFSYEGTTDPAQYKRTVALIVRDGILWWVTNQIRKFTAGKYVYSAFNCVALNDPSASSQSYCNPFAVTWDAVYHRPYRLYQCRFDPAYPELVTGDTILSIDQRDRPTALWGGLDALTDVSVFAPGGDQVLAYNAESGQWEAHTIECGTGTGGASLNYAEIYAFDKTAGNLNLTDTTWNTSRVKIDYISVEETTGNPTTFDLRIYETDTFHEDDLRYNARDISPADGWTDELEWIYVDRDDTNTFHFQISETGGSGQYDIHVRGISLS